MNRYLPVFTPWCLFSCLKYIVFGYEISICSNGKTGWTNKQEKQVNNNVLVCNLFYIFVVHSSTIKWLCVCKKEWAMSQDVACSCTIWLRLYMMASMVFWRNYISLFAWQKLVISEDNYKYKDDPTASTYSASHSAMWFFLLFIWPTYKLKHVDACGLSDIIV